MFWLMELCALFAADAPAPVHVVVSMSTDALTTALAVAGLGLALGSLVWQAHTWRSAGSRAVVESSIEIFPAAAFSALPGPKHPALASIPPTLRMTANPELLETLKPTYAGAMLVALIQNRGRTPRC